MRLGTGVCAKSVQIPCNYVISQLHCTPTQPTKIT